MTLIQPFCGIRPKPGFESRILAPPYDVLSSQEARERAQGNSDCFLHVSKAEIDLDPGVDPYSREVYDQAARRFGEFLKRGILIQDAAPCFYGYRLEMGSHRQTGIVGAASVEAYDQGRIRKHENTQPKKLEDRIRHIEALKAQTGPVFLTYRQTPALQSLVEKATQGDPVARTEADHGVIHTLWRVEDSNAVEGLEQALDALDFIYIADGHHRSEAASRVAQRNPGLPHSQCMLTVSFPDDEVHIWDYNRVITDLGGLTPNAFLQRLSESFDMTPLPRGERPQEPGSVSMYLGGSWHSLVFRGTIPQEDPVAVLDISLLDEHVLKPVLGIHDQRRDPRIDFVGGRRGLEELQRRVDSGEMAVAFAVRPPTLRQLMAVADANRMMPTKSTWFEPKLADGMISLSLED